MSSSSNNSTSTGGIGFTGLLPVLFIGLKLTNYIAWSWLWVLCPLWIPLVVVLGVFFVIFLISAIQTMVDK